MDKRIYKFSYGKKINFVVNRLLIILINSFFCVIFAFILIFIYGIVESNFSEDGNVKPIAIILFSIICPRLALCPEGPGLLVKKILFRRKKQHL